MAVAKVAPPGPSVQNGINWSAPPAANVPIAPMYDIGGQMADAAIQAPQIAAERDDATATAKAHAQAATSSADDAMLGRVTQGLMANPALANAPALKGVLGGIFQRRGLSTPLNADGSIDVDTISKMAHPPAVWGQGEFSPDKIKEWMTEPTEVRAPLKGSVIGAPDWFFSSAAKAPLTATGETAIYKQVNDTMAHLAEGKGTAGDLLTAVQSARNRLQASGVSTAGLDVFLSDDGTKLSPNIMQQLSSDYATAKINQIEALTGVAVNREAMSEKFIKRRMAELDSSDVRADKKINLEDRRLTLQMQTAHDNLAARWASINNTDNFHKFMEGRVGGSQLPLLKAQYQAVVSEYDKAQATLNANKRAIANGADSADLLDTTTTANNTIRDLGPQVELLRSKILSLPATATQNITGNNTKVTHSDNKPPAQKTYNKGDIYTDPEGVKWKMLGPNQWQKQ
jgi:hypothetical protein